MLRYDYSQFGLERIVLSLMDKMIGNKANLASSIPKYKQPILIVHRSKISRYLTEIYYEAVAGYKRLKVSTKKSFDVIQNREVWKFVDQKT